MEEKILEETKMEGCVVKLIEDEWITYYPDDDKSEVSFCITLDWDGGRRWVIEKNSGKFMDKEEAERVYDYILKNWGECIVLFSLQEMKKDGNL
jgi:hypothetical protein